MFRVEGMAKPGGVGVEQWLHLLVEAPLAIIGPAGASETRRTFGAGAAGCLVLLIVWTIYTGTPIPIDEWQIGRAHV